MTESSRRLDALTSLRFFAAFAIVMHHARDVAPVSWDGKFPLDQAVALFFALSGFILTYNYPELPTAGEINRFWQKRFARLWPVHFVTLLWILALGVDMGNNLLPLAANLLMIHAWIPDPRFFFGFNSPSWSISTETGFYILFPLLIYQFPRTWHVKLVAAGLLIPTCGALADVLQIHGSWLLYFNPLARLFEFVAGMCAALLYGRLSQFRRPHPLLWSFAELAIIAFIISAVILPLNRELTFRDYLLLWSETGLMPVLTNWALHSYLIIFFAPLILLFAVGQGLVSRTLTLRPLVFLGEASFSLYMIHRPMSASLNRIPYFTAADETTRLIVYLIAAVAASCLCYLAIERPSRSAIMALFRARLRIKITIKNAALHFSQKISRRFRNA